MQQMNCFDWNVALAKAEKSDTSDIHISLIDTILWLLSFRADFAVIFGFIAQLPWLAHFMQVALGNSTVPNSYK